MPSPDSTEILRAGAAQTIGSLVCLECATPVHLDPGDAIPPCPGCGGGLFHRASIFETAISDAPLVESSGEEEPDWLDELRDRITEPGFFLAFDDDRGPRSMRLDHGWTRVGRSRSADLRLNHPTVSRRHAQIVVLGRDEGLRVIDDRSLNGVFRNGERIEWAGLEDGDELTIGAYRLFVIDTARVPACA